MTLCGETSMEVGKASYMVVIHFSFAQYSISTVCKLPEDFGIEIASNCEL